MQFEAFKSHFHISIAHTIAKNTHIYEYIYRNKEKKEQQCPHTAIAIFTTCISYMVL